MRQIPFPDFRCREGRKWKEPHGDLTPKPPCQKPSMPHVAHFTRSASRRWKNILVSSHTPHFW